MGISTTYHTGAAVFYLVCGNIPMAVVEGGSALKSYAMGEILAPITEPIKDYFCDGVEASCESDIVDNLPFL